MTKENRSKYGSKKVDFDGYTFDSKDEAAYYLLLKRKKEEGKIINFELQPKYWLIPTFKKESTTFRGISYSPDFLINHLDGSKELIDIKGFSTQQGELRYKLFNYHYKDLKLTWLARNLKHGGDTGFVDYFELKKIRRENKKCN